MENKATRRAVDETTPTLRYSPVGQPTGRPWFPGFVARSRSDPVSVLNDPAAWAQSWIDARARLAVQSGTKFNRW